MLYKRDVYIIRSISYEKLYIVQTQNLEKRISDHNKGIIIPRHINHGIYWLIKFLIPEVKQWQLKGI
ncbi:MAG: hypothetical protein DRI73_09335 [Bacteroidetes bacterium]|nr:MAG: hypothetical protein DRI73_09335 [Bacteroidota bacterium]